MATHHSKSNHNIFKERGLYDLQAPLFEYTFFILLRTKGLEILSLLHHDLGQVRAKNPVLIFCYRPGRCKHDQRMRRITLPIGRMRMGKRVLMEAALSVKTQTSPRNRIDDRIDFQQNNFRGRAERRIHNFASLHPSS